MIWFFVKGSMLGLALAAPVGPIGLMCIRRSIARGRREGFFAGMGAATADTFYGAVAAFGMTSVSDTLVGYQTYIRVFGGIFLAWVGFGILRSSSEITAEAAEEESLFKNYVHTVILTLSNPATILAFVAAFSIFSLGEASRAVENALALTMGVFIGSAAWWLFLSWMASTARGFFNDRGILIVNRASGVMLLGFAAFSLLSVFWSFHP